jgi:hypothetical protein
MLRSIFGRRKRAEKPEKPEKSEKSESDAFWDGFSASFWANEQHSYVRHMRKMAREAAEGIPETDDPAWLPSFVAMRPTIVALGEKMERTLPFSSLDEYIAFTVYVRAEITAARQRTPEPLPSCFPTTVDIPPKYAPYIAAFQAA